MDRYAVIVLLAVAMGVQNTAARKLAVPDLTTTVLLLEDALRLARQAATAAVEVTLDITPRVPHVFQAYHPILDEAAVALDRAGQFLSAHLANAARVTGERKAERKLSSTTK